MWNQKSIFSAFYFLIFFAWGAYYPLISQYYKRIGMTGEQIGTALAAGTIVAIISQPIWGYLSDKKGLHKQNLVIMTIGLILTTAVMPISKDYVFITISVIVLNIFQSGTTPVVDSIVTGTGLDYGKVRLWGSIGFAVAALISGILTDVVSIYVIFALYSVSCIGVLFSLRHMDMPKVCIHSNKRSDPFFFIRNKEFLLVLVCAFLLYGTLNTQNTYFGILYEKLGGTMSGVGVAMLLFAISEVPLLRVTGKLILKFGAWTLMLISGIITCSRWYWYGTLSSPVPVISTFFLHGIIIALFIPAAIHLIGENTKSEQRAMGMTLYYALGSGLGTAVCQYFAGKSYDSGGISAVYNLLALMAGLSVIVSMTAILLKKAGTKK